ncbi:MAG TPA: DUF4157 domain-containing protein [Pyrinomonadaceae bacterium]|nr:DUF4157 domain-containing protein [Pyrinomonadaceae bacterium]
MKKPPQNPRRNATAAPSAGARPGGFPQRQSAQQAKPAAAAPQPKISAAPQLNRAHAAAHTLQPKMNAATPRAAADSSGAGLPHGVIQANVIGGTRALFGHLVALHAAAQRESVSRAASVQRHVAAGHAASRVNTASAQTVQRKSSVGVDAFKVALQPKSGGLPLPTEVRAKMESAFGSDFSDVRVHVGQEASRIGALAYTWGTNIHFAPGQYNPHTLQGQKILGHELWHVVQQKSGRVKNPFGGGVAVVQDHALEAEADRMGLKAAMTATPRDICCGE